MTVRVDRRGAVTVITIDRVDKRNAIDAATTQALDAAFYEFNCTAVEVEVDRETGELLIVKHVSVADVGKALNPAHVEAHDVEGGREHDAMTLKQWSQALSANETEAIRLVGEERYRVLRRVLSGELDSEEIIRALKDSGLRGMGGAGFPTGNKWELVSNQEAEPKYAICNADESEPGSFKDRQVLAEQPHLVLEGLLLGMVVTGAEQGWVFIRHEYGPEEEVLREELASLHEAGLLGEDVLGSGKRLEVDVFTSPGGYILGEESALIECMEGHRGEPRNKPPFPGIYGLWGQPTLMNSVETFADVPVIVERGADWWRDQGIGEATGLKFFAVSGHVERPGVYCLPMGTTLGELLDAAGGVQGGAELLAIQPGGASSNFLGPDRLDVPLDFDPMVEAGSMLGAGAVVVVAEGTDLLASATNVLRFFRNESCGKCVPCRVGSHKALLLLNEVLSRGEGPEAIERELEQLEETTRMTSICGLGQVALGPVMSVLRMRTEGQEGEQAGEVGPTRTHDA